MNWRKLKISINILLVIFVILISILVDRSIKVSGTAEEKQPIYSVDTEEKVVSLTFDVNWAEKENLQSILDILDKYNVKGTFFIMGGWVNYSEENVSKLKEISERGHEIGNHSYKHPSFSKITNDAIEEEIRKTDDIIEKYTGKRPILFRFPSGDYNQSALMKVNSLNHIAIQWNADSVDWKEMGADIEYNKVMKNTKSGSILLFHNNAKYTPENLDRIIKELKSQGYEFKPVGEMIYTKGYYIDKNGIQHKN